MDRGNLPSTFDVNSFQSAIFEGKGDTRRVRVEPKEYPAQIVGPWGEKTKLKTEAGYLILEVVWQPDDEEQRQKLGLDKLPTLRQSIFLDLTPSGALDMGQLKNGDLNRLREAIGLNQDGQQWKFPDFIGRPARIKVVHKPNKEDAENPFQNVTAVSSLR
jgi:hypothetical protein